MARLKKINDEVYIAEDSIVQIDSGEMTTLKEQAGRNSRHRVRVCAHKNAQDRLHEMLIVLTEKVYIRPHKHLNKTESFHVIDGTATVVFFNDDGGIEEVIRIGDSRSGKPFYFRNDDARYHTQIITSGCLAFHEITNGPFNPADTVFAPWAPDEADIAAVAAYREKLARQVAQKEGKG